MGSTGWRASVSRERRDCSAATCGGSRRAAPQAALSSLSLPSTMVFQTTNRRTPAADREVDLLTAPGKPL
jgi:hypothetical protein